MWEVGGDGRQSVGRQSVGSAWWVVNIHLVVTCRQQATSCSNKLQAVAVAVAVAVSSQQSAVSSQQPAVSSQQSAASSQQSAVRSRQQAAGSRQQAAGSSRQQAAILFLLLEVAICSRFLRLKEGRQRVGRLESQHVLLFQDELDVQLFEG
jgi:hypothetical protein